MPDMKRGLCYFKDKDGNTIVMRAVTEYSYSLSAKASDNKIEDGSSVADNIVLGKRSVQYSGVVTDMLTGDLSTIEPSDYRIAIERVMTDKQVFTFVVDDYDFEEIPNCVITDISFNRDVSNTYGYSVQVSIEQLRFITQASITRTVIPNSNFKGRQEATKNTGSNPTVKVEEDRNEALKRQLKILEKMAIDIDRRASSGG